MEGHRRRHIFDTNRQRRTLGFARSTRPGLRPAVGLCVLVILFRDMVVAFVTGFVQMVLQLLLRFPAALPHGPDLLRARRRFWRTLSRTIPLSFVFIVHKGVVSPDPSPRKLHRRLDIGQKTDIPLPVVTSNGTSASGSP